MPKPIAVFYIPSIMDIGGKLIDYNACANLVDDLHKQMSDYHWFCLIENDNNIQSPYLKVFYEKDFSETKYEELKKHLESKIEEYKTNHNANH